MENPRRTYTLEEVNAFRAEVHRILMARGESKDSADYVCGYSSDKMIGDITVEPFIATPSDIISRWSYVMWQSPEEYADLMTM